ncbi:Phthiocerol dimycocerosate exporter MmpL7 [Mycobacterium simulans]|uniref:Phthiocerol dimycocerosate exporter MmpL7 n=1 Tax=Mycobacterium simulans TaxID=627089 RepID=A0A7Z7N925_9MYCO|nr:MMPL family transporter [Mycobacterium simulans]SOJ54337.1 Phthiocerol dimycocerosate exporter MmpL7 [Mycobacterium simulans]
MGTDDAEPRSRLAKLVVIAAWIAVAVIANVILALTHAKAGDTGSALLPHDAKTAAASSRIGQAFPGTGTNAIAYLSVDGRDTLGPADKHYYDTVVTALRADTAHVGAVLDWWSDPLTAALGTSPDGRSAVAMVWLKGEAGSIQAQRSLEAARMAIRKLPPSAGLRAHIAAPATTSDLPLQMTAWQGAAIVTAAALLAVLLMLRARLSKILLGITLVSSGLSLAVTWPLTAVLRGITVFSVTLAAVLTLGTVTASTMLVARREPDPTTKRAYRDALPAFVLPGACVAVLTGPLLLAQTPALYSVGIAAVGVVVALAASLTLIPALLGLAGPAWTSAPRGDGRVVTPPRSMPSFFNPVVAVVVVLGICALPVIGMRWNSLDSSAKTSAAQFVPGRSLPDVVVVKSDHDLRDPAGLIAIDAVSRRLMEIPGVRKVESAAWPAGVPWTEASLTSAAGRLGDQLDRQAVTFVPQVNAIKSLASTVDQVNAAVKDLEASMTAGLSGLTEMQQVINRVVAGTRNIKDTTVQVSGYLDPMRDWAGGIADCPADVLCSAARKIVDPLDRVVADVAVLSDGADRIAAISARTAGALTSTPQAVAQMQSALEQLRSFVPTLERTVEQTIPQVVQLSTFLKNLSNDFADTGAGGFYLSRKALADPSYQNVRATMFSSDGAATRLFVYSAGDKPDLNAAARAQQLETVVANATKYGSLVDSQITLNGAAHLAATVHSAVTHDAVLLAITLLAVLALVAMWRGAVIGFATGLGVLASYLAALGISVAIWQHLLGHALHASVAPVSFAILAACGIPYLLAAAVSVRGALAPLMALGAAFGGGLVLVSSGSFSALGQIGSVIVLGLGTLTVVRRCIPAAVFGDRTPPTLLS